MNFFRLLRLAFCLAALIPISSETADWEGPNILLIVSDDQGYNDLGILGMAF